MQLAGEAAVRARRARCFHARDERPRARGWVAQGLSALDENRRSCAAGTITGSLAQLLPLRGACATLSSPRRHSPHACSSRATFRRARAPHPATRRAAVRRGSRRTRSGLLDRSSARTAIRAVISFAEKATTDGNAFGRPTPAAPTQAVTTNRTVTGRSRENFTGGRASPARRRSRDQARERRPGALRHAHL